MPSYALEQVENLTKFVTDVGRAMGLPESEAGSLVTRIITRRESLSELFTADGKLDGMKANAALAEVMAPVGTPKPVPAPGHDPFYGYTKEEFFKLRPEHRLDLVNKRALDRANVGAAEHARQTAEDTAAALPANWADYSPEMRINWANAREAAKRG